MGKPRKQPRAEKIVAPPAPEIPGDDSPLESTLDPEPPGEIVSRPDGYHWIAPDGRQEFGPFASFEEACAYRDALDERTPAPAQDELQEVENDIGIADWIDPDTGELAEGQCPPHLQED